MTAVKPPAPRPCISCPYRRDCPSGIWAAEEYEKLPGYDNETATQPMSVFMCHQQDGRLCAGWVAVHDMEHNFGLRLASQSLEPEDIDAILDYTTDVPLFASGAEAAAHGLRELDAPPEAAHRLADKIRARREAL